MVKITTKIIISTMLLSTLSAFADDTYVLKHNKGTKDSKNCSLTKNEVNTTIH